MHAATEAANREEQRVMALNSEIRQLQQERAVVAKLRKDLEKQQAQIAHDRAIWDRRKVITQIDQNVNVAMIRPHRIPPKLE